MQINVHTTGGTDGAGDVYLNGHARSDLGDVCFTASDGQTLLNYWMQSAPSAFENTRSLTMNISASWVDRNGILYAGANNGSLYKSFDQGQTWGLLKSINGATELHSVYVAANGYVYFSPVGNSVASSDVGLWRSTDNGTSWSRTLALSTSECIWGIDQDSNGNIFAGVYTIGSRTNARIFKSSDNGSTWNSVYYDSTVRHVHQIAVDPSNNYVYATIGDNPTLYVLRSTNGGSSWSQILTGIPQCVGIYIGSGFRLFGSDTTGNGQIYRTTDDSSYSTVWDAGATCQGFWIRGDSTAGKIYASFVAYGSVAEMVSSDNGQTWSTCKSLPVAVTYDGSGYVSNFVNGIAYYSAIFEGVFVSGTKMFPDSLASFWVQDTDNLSSQNSTIYVYYGNPSAATTSNGYNTFPYFENFESGDTRSWSTYTAGTGIVSTSSTHANGAYSLEVNKPSGTANLAAASQQISATGLTQFKFGLKFYQQGPTSTTYGYHLAAFEASKNAQTPTWTGAHVAHFDADNTIQYYSNGWKPTTGQTTQEAWTSLLIKHKVSTFSLIVNDIVIGTYNNFNDNNVQAVHLGVQADGLGGSEVGYFDDLFLAKFVDPEPMHGAWGSEESGNVVVINEAFASDGRADVGSIQTVGFHAEWNNNGSDVVGGSIYVNGTNYVTNSTGWISFNVSSPTVRRDFWIATGVNCNGVTTYMQTAQAPSIIWDQIKITDGGLTKNPVMLGETTTIWFKATYEYDNGAFDGTNGILYVNGSPMAWSAINNRWEYAYTANAPGTTTFSISKVSDNSYNLTAISDTVGTQIVTIVSSPFSIISNSTISELAFNSTSKVLTFTVSGPSGTTGYTNVTIAKSLIGNITDLKVYLDGNEINYTTINTDYFWLIHFTYHQSTHKVLITLGSSQVESFADKVIVICTAIMVILLTTLLITRRRRKQR